jgi:hypothetical protein
MLTDDEIRALLENVKVIHPMYGAEVPAGTIAELCTRLLSAEARVKVLEGALREIASQKQEHEMTGGEAAYADWNGGYEQCIDRARTALQEQSK